MVSLQTLREMILEVMADNRVHTRPELIAYAQNRFGMKYYDADQRTTSALQSLLKKDTIGKLEKGVYQLHPVGEAGKQSVLEQIRAAKQAFPDARKQRKMQSRGGMEL